MVKRAVTVATAVGGLMLTTFPTAARAWPSPAATPSALALSDIPPHYLSYYTGAARTCPGLPWQVLAAIGSIESDHGRSQAPDVHGPTGRWGPEGPMQFEASTFAEYAARLDRGKQSSPYDPEDSIYTAARMLCANGAAGGSPGGVAQAVYSYNHAGWYVNDVLSLARRYSGTPTRPARPRARPARPARPRARPAPSVSPSRSARPSASVSAPGPGPASGPVTSSPATSGLGGTTARSTAAPASGQGYPRNDLPGPR